MKRGKFIVIEGIDGSGTTTQAAMLHASLTERGVRAHLTCEPTNGPVGVLIRSVLSGRISSSGARPFDRRALALLFAADRLDHLAYEVEPHLASGETVISDRYTLSSVAYQSLDCDPAWVRQINRLAPLPDLYVFLRVAAKAADERISRSRSAREIFEELPFQEKVARGYEKAIRSLPKSRLFAIDGALSREEVFAALSLKVSKLLKIAGG
jgi:dTMP kinase